MTDTIGRNMTAEVGEVGLYRSVVARAILDLFGSQSIASHQDEVRVARDEALSFLTAEIGGWAQSREMICGICDLEPSILRDQVIAILEGQDPPDEARELTFAKLDVARELWAQKKTEAARAQAARARQAKIVAQRRSVFESKHSEQADELAQHTAAREPVKLRYSEMRAIVLDQIKQKPRKFREILHAVEGADHQIRTVLNNALAKGEIVRSSTFVYSIAPSSLVEAEPEAA